MNLRYAVVLVVLSGCFASSRNSETGCEPELDPCGAWEEVASCEGQANCVESTGWCVGTVYCLLDSPPICTESRPVCADSVEVRVCPGNANCVPFEWCGQTFYCASEICSGVEPSCPSGEELSDVSCAPGEAGCTEMMSCEGTYYCRVADCFDPVFEPCADATSTVWAMSEGQCPDFDEDAYCHETSYCGGLHYCVTACADGDNEVFHPSECVNPSDCYPADPSRDDLPPSWCQGGGGPACRAIPTCEGGEEIPLDALCDDDGYCEFRSRCSTTIQCFFGIVVG